MEDGTKVRVAKKTGNVIPKPGWKVKPRQTNPERDTTPESAVEKTYTHSEFVELKNRFLRIMELNYYKQLRYLYEENRKKQLRQSYEQKIFDLQVYQRAQELLREKKIQALEAKKD